MKMLGFVLISMLALTGCAMQPKPTPPPLPVAQIVGIDPSLLIRCSLLPYISTPTIQMAGLFTHGSSLQIMYNTCAIRNDRLIDAAEAIINKVNTANASSIKK